MIDQPTETQNRENPATQSHGSKVNLYFDHDRQTAAAVHRRTAAPRRG
jgi:hypothetical protein